MGLLKVPDECEKYVHELLMGEYNIQANREKKSEFECRPSIMLRIHICRDGDKWCALYGADIQNGVCGFGDSPDEAMLDFDKAWKKNI